MLGTVATVLFQDHEIRHTEFQQLPYHRIFIMLLVELNQPEPILEAINFQVLQTFRCVSYLILCAVILWWFQKKVTTDSTLCVALRRSYVRDDRWILRVCSECMGDIQGYWYVISWSYAWYCLKTRVCCTLNAQRFATFVPWVAEFFFFHACAGSFVVGRHIFGQRLKPWAAHEKSLAPRARKEIIENRKLSFNL